MNTYKYQFYSKCPSDGDIIQYNLTMHNRDMIHVEHIKTACALMESGYQENIAKQLQEAFGGIIDIEGTHQGVHARTQIGSL